MADDDSLQRNLQSVASQGIHNKLSFFEEYIDGLEHVLELSQLRHVHLGLEVREVSQSEPDRTTVVRHGRERLCV